MKSVFWDEVKITECFSFLYVQIEIAIVLSCI